MLDRPESDVSSDTLVDRLKAKEQDPQGAEQPLAVRDGEKKHAATKHPTDLGATCQKPPHRRDTLLAKAEHVVGANRLNGDLIVEIGV